MRGKFAEDKKMKRQLCRKLKTMMTVELDVNGYIDQVFSERRE